MGTGRTRFVLRPPVDDAPVPHRRAHLRERAYVLRGVTVEHDDVGREPRRDCVRGPGRQREALAPGPLNSCLVGASTRPGAGSSLLPVSASVWSNAAVEAVPETIEALTAASSRAAWDASLRCRY